MAVKISQKGWVVIPAELRRKYSLYPGDEIELVDYGGVLALVPVPQHPIELGAGLLKGGNSLTETLLDEHARELQQDG